MLFMCDLVTDSVDLGELSLVLSVLSSRVLFLPLWRVEDTSTVQPYNVCWLYSTRDRKMTGAFCFL